MEEDFGYTKRDKKALRRARALEDNSMNDEQERRVVNIHPKHYSKGEFNCETAEGVAEGGITSTETGSYQVNTVRSRCQESSVARDTSNVLNAPNVVEYHPKVELNINKKIDRPKGDFKEMRTDKLTALSKSHDDKKNLVSQLSRLSIDNNVFEGSSELPQVFQVKYLGSHDARGLWGIKHTRKPVDNMVAAAKSLPTDTILPLMKLVVSRDGVALVPIGQRKSTSVNGNVYPIETISYGVQDLIYTRVFTMIIVRDTVNFRRISPFECHGFVCESKHHARQMTYALATAFQIYSQTVKTLGNNSDNPMGNIKKRFAIDLRTPDEIETDLTLDSEA
ncbi:hypothetical protein PV328_004641 [Microctonus aethiopoides]|uniref:PID domain-containing protein n=1 Tax=Microctonus aethiopoides TaxID=144406 RepID=A0AA39FAZ9_9HYME|nr:hypothetical protein PV328_004641 [Microctonus aethiopoides]